MPTYTYRCKECDYQFDQRQSFSDDPLTVCPNCEADNGLRKVVNSVGIVFKGSGFYVTDNGNGKGKVSVPANNGSENTASESSGSSDAKTAKAESQNGFSEKNSTPAKEKSTTTT